MRKKSIIFITYCLLLLSMFVSACMPTNVSGHQTPTTALTSITHHGNATQVLQRSNIAMAHVQSMHFEVNATRQPETIDAAPADILKALKALPGGTEPTINTQVNGDIAAPDFSRIDVTQQIKASSGGFTIHAIVQKDNVYHEEEESNWYVISKENLQATNKTSFSIDAGLPQINALLKLALQQGILHNLGNKTIGGKKLQHIQATFGKSAFQALQTIDLENTPTPAPSINQFSTVTDTADFWIDSNTGYVYQLINTMNLDPTRIQTLDFQCSAFNQPISIRIPAQAIPITNVDQIPHLEAI